MAVEISMNSLRGTLGKANAYNSSKDPKHANLLRSHVQDLIEDIAQLERYRNSFKEKEEEALELINEARGVKREMEKTAFILEEVARKKAPAPANNSAPATANASAKSSGSKLPRIKLPMFDGETSEDYRGFINAFDDAIESEPDLGDVKKWLLLRAQLSGRALNLVKELPMASATYQVAIQILEDAYGSSKQTIHKLYIRLQRMQQADMNPLNLRETYSQIEGILLSLTNLGVTPEKDDFLRAVIIGKYPGELIDSLRITDDTTLAALRKEVNDYIRRRSSTMHLIETLTKTHIHTGTKGGADGTKGKPKHDQSRFNNNGGGSGTPPPPSQVTDSSKNNSSRNRREFKKVCVFCTGDHFNDECDKHKTLAERKELIKDRCNKCLRPDHADSECKTRRTCFYCRDPAHHSALCPKQYSKVLFSAADGTGETTSINFPTAVFPVGNHSRTKGAEVRAVLDTCGGRSLITEKLARELELDASTHRRTCFKGVGDAPLSNSPSSAKKLLLFPPNARPIEINVFVVPKITDNVKSTSVDEVKRNHPRYADLPMPRDGNGEDIQLLIGYRGLIPIVTLQKSIFISPSLQLMSTKFGWIPFGGLTDDEVEKMESSVIGLFQEADPVKMMSDLELIGLDDFLKTENEEEATVLDKFYSTIRRLSKRYMIEWPFRSDDPELDDNFGLAFGRLISLYRQLSKDPALLEAYDKIIKEQLEDDIVEPVNLWTETKGKLISYIPHRANIRLGKSTPIRMVFDASARSSKTARSLNDLLMKGGNWVNEIPAILIRFRRYGIAVTTDIVKAFHQIAIAPKDRDVVRFLWLRDQRRPPTKENICVYRFKRMAFGVIASPFLLTATIKHHLREFPNEFGERIEQDLYADNLITSLPRGTDCAHFYRTTVACFDGMSMKLSQWATDDSEARHALMSAELLSGDVQSVLGVAWNVRLKEMNVRSPHLDLNSSTTLTKRVVLKELAKVYDPLGWVSPMTLLARLFLRRVWNLKNGWDVPLTAELAAEWRGLQSQLNQTANVILKRPYGFGGLENAKRIELHTFCDASAVAYGFIVYLCVHEENKSWSGIVAAKSRLAPATKLSIPRLELLAAVTASRFTVWIEQALKLDQDITKHLWGDSRCVIAWVSSNKILPAFVEKSVKTIRAAKFKKFMYVPTSENPADAASRGASIIELREQEWWRGPVWLISTPNWPQQQDTCQNETEIQQGEIEREYEEENAQILFLHATIRLKKHADPIKNDGAPFNLNPNDFPTMGNLIRRTAFCLRAAGRFLRGRGTISPQGSLDYESARWRWIRWDQQRTYEASETDKTNVSYLRNLKASTDENGIIRCETRLKNAKITRNEAEPILLVKKSALTKLIILTFHFNNKHVGTAHTLAALRRQYWLPHGRREVYHIIKTHCHACPRYDTQPLRTPEMAPLPPFRVNRTETPFTNVGVDAFGPFKVRCGTERDAPIKKKWILIFTCLIVRAIHLEILNDMTALEFLNSFRRFIGRRGVPEVIISDNAPQFYAVEGYFQCIWRRFAEADVTQKYYAQHCIKWKFIPPHAPWMGGAYERLVREVKRAFEKVYGSLTLYQNQFEIAIIEIEGVLNGRPITYVDQENETELITPNDFLRVKYPAIPTNFENAPLNSSLTELWRNSQEYVEQFWRLWAEQYLREIRERRDSMRNSRTAEDHVPVVGEVVLMVDPMLKRSSWRTAVVERLIKGEDDKVRSVQIRSANRTRMIRPVAKLASLKLLMDLPEDAGELTSDGQAVVVDGTDGEAFNLDNTLDGGASLSEDSELNFTEYLSPENSYSELYSTASFISDMVMPFAEAEANLDEFNRNLPHTVTLLNGPNGSLVYVVGTGHFSVESQNDVSKVMQAVKPHILVVELCVDRASVMQMDEEAILKESRDFSLDKLKSIFNEAGVFQGIIYVLLLKLSANLTKNHGIAPGGEFRRALKEFFNYLFSVEEIERYKQKDIVEEMMAKLLEDYPDLSHVLINERDMYLTHSLQMAAAKQIISPGGSKLHN
ncbi:hypothetical protein V9T40_009425 [Parthenolecanium corni]|uniref:Integrase catalytic domain-containing protein n=1 Tax=Parthenolecanium corni TaxID=536013 RepID=A0AAN9Y854_9HEMI